jgi:hypothetical protein
VSFNQTASLNVLMVGFELLSLSLKLSSVSDEQPWKEVSLSSARLLSLKMYSHWSHSLKDYSTSENRSAM